MQPQPQQHVADSLASTGPRLCAVAAADPGDEASCSQHANAALTSSDHAAVLEEEEQQLLPGAMQSVGLQGLKEREQQHLPCGEGKPMR